LGEIGLDTTEDAQSAITKVKETASELESLKSHLNEEAAKQRADKLETKIREFLRKNAIE